MLHVFRFDRIKISILKYYRIETPKTEQRGNDHDI